MDQHSNIITAPDFPTENFDSVLIIDPTLTEIETLAFFLKTTSISFNVFIYHDEMQDQEWLEAVVNKVSTIIVNTIPNSLSAFKDRLAVAAGVYYYGEKRFLMNNQRLENPIDFFVSRINQI